MYIAYQVVHKYGAEGDFGGYVPESEVIATFVSERDADAFVERFAKPHVYDNMSCADDLDCGNLIVEEIAIYGTGKCNLDEVDTTDFWWLKV